MTLPEFPKSECEPFSITSPETPNYNCIAWAYQDDTKWYWPDDTSFWPDGVIREVRIDSFIMLFEKIGFDVCNGGDLESGFDKIAIYCDEHSNPTHAARQLDNGFWTSKLGQSFDVTHTIISMSGGVYGNVAVYMKRKTIKDNEVKY